jgi:hypothetical protein
MRLNVLVSSSGRGIVAFIYLSTHDNTDSTFVRPLGASKKLHSILEPSARSYMFRAVYPWPSVEDTANNSMTSVTLGELDVLMGKDRPERSCRNSSSATSGGVVHNIAKETSRASCCSEPNGHRQLNDSSDRGCRASRLIELRTVPPAL